MRGLDRLLRPGSIAVIGGGTWCTNVIAECRRIGFGGDIWPVHPTRTEIGGVPTRSSVSCLPASPDAAFVGVNRLASIDVVRDLARLETGGAVCFASGFSEAKAELADGADLQAALLQAAGHMPVLGPNCYGFINAVDGVALWPDHHGMKRCSHGVAIVTQSSNLSINLTMQQRGLPIAYMVTAGNQAQTDISAIGQAVLGDPRVSALGLHIEGIRNLSGFIDLARLARNRGIPIVVLKVGASDQARAAMISHTSSLAGSDDGARALFKRLGIGRVSTPAAFLETLKLLHVTGGLPSRRIASISCSGGEASLMADLGTAAGLEFPDLDQTQIRGLRAALGPKVALSNPLDYHTYVWGDLAATTACFSALMSGDLAMGCAILDFPRQNLSPAPDWHKVVDAVWAAQTATGRPMSILATLPENMPEPVAEAAVARGIVPFAGAAEAMEALSTAAKMHDTAVQPDILIPGDSKGEIVLPEADAKTELAAFGLHVPRSKRITRANLRTARELGYPLVLKGEGVAHKTEAGAVALGLTSETDLQEAGERMGCASFLAEEMITGTVAELLVGILRDPAHGFILTLGAGGTLTEIIADTTTLLLPADRSEIRSALGRLRLFPLLTGYRGKKAANIDAVLDAVEAVQRYVAAHRDTVIEVEINPLICRPDKAIAADAIIRKGESA